MPRDIRFVEYDGQYGPHLQGLKKSANAPSLAHNFTVWYPAQRGELLFPEVIDRPSYSLLQFPVSLVNVGDEDLVLPNAFVTPAQYQSSRVQARWAVGTKYLSLTLEGQGEVRRSTFVLMAWNIIKGGGGLPDLPLAPYAPIVAAGYGATSWDAGTSVDTTGLPAGDYLLTLELHNGGATPVATHSLGLFIDKATVRLA